MKRTTAIVLLFFFAAASASVTPQDEKNAMCSSEKICLGVDIPECSEEEKKPLEDVTYDGDFCGPFYELRMRGLNPHTEIAKEMFKHLGQRYRVIYEQGGILPVNGDMMSYLFDHLPFTTKLVNAYQGTAYDIHYKSADHRSFAGTNGENLYGDFYWVLQDSAGMYKGFRNVFFGDGKCKILKWYLHGIAIAFVDMAPFDAKHTQYKFKAFVFPANSMLNTIMQLSVFRNVVINKIQGIIINISVAADGYDEGNHKPVENSADLKKQPYREQLDEFTKVSEGKIPWTVGDDVDKRNEKKRVKRPTLTTERPLIFKQQEKEK